MAEDFAGFTDDFVEISGAHLHVRRSGRGPGVLLLRGFPQTHLAWRHVAPTLAAEHAVVCPDLVGYGLSTPPPPGEEPWSMRVHARVVVELMARLGHRRFGVVGHDRGALVAFRAALDSPEAVERLAVIGVVPTIDLWEALRGPSGVFAFHLFLLAHPGEVGPRLIGADPEAFFGHFLAEWPAEPSAIPPDVRAAYVAAAARPEVIRSICEDYRASAFVDPVHDEADRRAGRRLTMPTLAVWPDPGDQPLPFDPAEVWRRWADDLHTLVLPGGHFLPEERPGELLTAVRRFLG